MASTRGGRQAHPPKSQTSIRKSINKKEKSLALCSAIAATASRPIVESRGHRVSDVPSLPIVVDDEAEGISSTKGLEGLLVSLGAYPDVQRLHSRKARSGKPLLRGRPKKTGKSVLIVARSTGSLLRACGSVAGVDAVTAENLSVLDLAPGSSPGRLVMYTAGAVGELSRIKSPHLELLVALG